MKTTWRISASILAFALAHNAASAQQAEGAPAGENALPDIVVTATRQSTNLQSTPIAITAITAQALEARGLKSVADLTSVVPNAQFRRVQGAYGPGVSAFIRGVGQADTSLAGEPAVAFYLDDVYYPILLGSNFDLLDIDHIEVLRGPQGTLFGRNSLAGAVNVVSRPPRVGEASGYLEATVGSYARRELRGGMNIPIGNSVALSVSGLSREKRGYQRILDFTCEMRRRGTPALAGNFPVIGSLNQTATGAPLNNCTLGYLGGDDIRAGRASLLWEAAPNIKATVTGDYTRDHSGNVADYVVDINPALVSNNLRTQAAYWGLVVDSRFVTGNPFTSFATYSDQIAAGTVIPGNTYYNGLKTRGGYKLSPDVDLTNWGVSGKVVAGLTSSIDLTAVIAYRSIDETHAFDNDGTPLITTHTVLTNIDHYLNAEVRLGGKSDLIDWVAGLFYFDADALNTGNNIAANSGIPLILRTTYDSTSKAAFVNATVRPFGERLGIVLGGRYFEDKKVVNYTGLTDTGGAGDTRFNVVPSQKKFGWKLGANYQLTPAALLYASAATGNSLPGFNPRPLQPSQATQFDGNESIAYEVGTKLDLFDRRLRLNGAAFYTDFKKRPVSVAGSEAQNGVDGLPLRGSQVLVPLSGGPAGSTACRPTPQTPAEAAAGPGVVCIARTYYFNTPATIRGFELEATATPLPGLNINGNVGWSKFMSPDIKRRTVNRRQFNPFWTASAGIQYEHETEMLGGTITPRLDWIFQSSTVIGGVNTKYNSLNGAYSLFNGRISYYNREHRFTVTLGATNLFNKFYYVNFLDNQTIGGISTNGQPGVPREWYLRLSKNF